MRQFNKTISINPLRNSNGFTLIELVVVTTMIGILATIATANYIPLRKKALDTTAMVDARNLVDAITTAMLEGEDVKYTKTGTGAVGDVDNADNPRPPVYVLSPGVIAVINGTSNGPPDGATTNVTAIIYHRDGTAVGNIYGRKYYSCGVDEAAGVTSMPL